MYIDPDKQEVGAIFVLNLCIHVTVPGLRLLTDIELGQHFAYRGNSHRLKDAARHLID